MRNTSIVAPALASLLVVALVLFVYAPSLHGGFLFDDFANLPSLGAYGAINSWPAFIRYMTSGTADPLGRPLALLSFLIDAHDWPADPYPFKRTSLILHLINGVLLAALLRRLGRSIGHAEASTWRTDAAAVLGAGLWLLHPLFVSTTMYVVQREAMLPATFTLLGLLAWLRGRTAMQQGRTANGLIWITLGLGACTVLAVLSKANGILLPALALVIEYTVMRKGNAGAGEALPRAEVASVATGQLAGGGASAVIHGSAVGAEVPPARNGLSGTKVEENRAYRWAMGVMAWVPAIIVAAYLLYRLWGGMVHGIGRPWTLGQRLLTEPRVLMDYLGLLWLPRPFTPGLFNDHIQVSTSLVSPVTTLPAIVAVLGLIIGACLMRKRWPVLAMAVLFYFVGQSLESSTVALELYFEHRNYLPAMLMFWPLALWLCGVRQTGRTPRPVVAGAAETATRGTPEPADGHQADHNLVAASAAPTGAGGVSPAPADVWSRAKALLAVVLVLGLATMTWTRADLWGNVRDQALLWAKLNPDSPRALANAAQAEMRAGRPDLAVARLQPAVARAPDEVQLALNLFAAQCQIGRVDALTIAASETSLRTTRDPGTLLTSWFERAISRSAHPSCPQANLTTLERLLKAAENNPNLMKRAGRRQDIDYLRARIALTRGDADGALQYFNLALDQQVRVSAALQQAALLGSAGFPRQGLVHLDHYEAEKHLEHKPAFGMPRIHAWVLNRQQYWPKELARLRATLRDDARQQAAANE